MFSIIIPVYNSVNVIIRSVNSVLKQTFLNFEIIIVDDGSTDNTSNVVATINDTRIRYMYKSNGGPASARNLGIKHAKYKYVCFLDADDEYFLNKLEESAKVLKQKPDIDLIFTDALYINEENSLSFLFSKSTTIYNSSIYAMLLKNNFIVNSSVVLNKDRLAELGCLFDEDEGLKFVEDYDLWLRLAAKNANFYYLRKVLTKYHIHGSNNSRNAIRTYISLIRVFKKHLPRNPKLLKSLLLLRVKILLKSGRIS